SDHCVTYRKFTRREGQTALAVWITTIFDQPDRVVAQLTTRCLLFKQPLETLQVANVDVRYGPIGEITVAPMEQVIALASHLCLRFAISRCRWPNKQVNEMFTPLVHQRCCRVIIEIVKASANQRKTVTREIHHWSCKIELRIKPRFNSV